jgi:hypothetical protein
VKFRQEFIGVGEVGSDYEGVLSRECDVAEVETGDSGWADVDGCGRGGGYLSGGLARRRRGRIACRRRSGAFTKLCLGFG